MHEMGIALEIIDITIASVPHNRRVDEVKEINIQIGKFSTVSPVNLKFCFNIASADTELAKAHLSIEVIPVIVKCQNCKAQFEINEPIFKCKICYGTSVELVSGRELDIKSIEIENKE